MRCSSHQCRGELNFPGIRCLIITSRDKLTFYDFFCDFQHPPIEFHYFALEFFTFLLVFFSFLLVLTCVPLVFTCVHLCSLVLTCVHLCSLVFTCVPLVFTCVPLEFTCVYLCSTCVHLCSPGQPPDNSDGTNPGTLAESRCKIPGVPCGRIWGLGFTDASQES